MSSAADSPTSAAHSEGEPRYATRDQLRAMAHPVRMRIIERVGRRGTARAADLAADLDMPANSVSYHLRTLARGGVITEAPEAARDKRDRVWKLAQSNFQHAPAATPTGQAVGVDHEYLEASGATTLSAIEWIRSAWAAEIAQRTAHFPETEERQAFARLISAPLRLSPGQARELFETVAAKIDEFVSLNRDESGADLPGDPDSEGDAQDLQMLFTVVGGRPHRAGPEGAQAASPHSSSAASPSSRA
ncbi:winged helix-turn-helix domain-containing protein [Brachybacterium saurashtrense]|uniref:ArsR family transcriptional regulator n=1 Tax=Brachybacterium saurashtrense TaxID=556288 RepID=A0A345YL71_9MICO|nr:helix-turn-helix domain-containing protein [Brachybacterium saurashtrense]AXK44673.1 ArsR family transcriptional regulator [Brachybacterium saurashtrense]RRR23285.1 ArsR family transcriptional regulator [Brachybacterium saurashtrense]